MSNHVYLVYADNGEEDGYDYYVWLDSVHLTEESARKYILETGITRVKNAIFHDSESNDGKVIAIYSAPKEISIYSDEWRPGCNSALRIEKWEAIE